MRAKLVAGSVFIAALVLAFVLARYDRGERLEKPEEPGHETASDESFEDLYRRTTELANEGNYEAALPLYEKLLKTGSWEPDSRSLHAGLLRDYGNCQISAGKPREALEILQLAADDYQMLTWSGQPPGQISRITLRAQMVGCLTALERYEEATKGIQEFDQLFADFDGNRREKLVQWRKQVGEILSSKK